MKLIAILIFGFTLNTFGQFISSYGIKGGMGISNQVYENVSFPYKSYKGVSVRVFVDFFKESDFQLETELGFIRRGRNGGADVVPDVGVFYNDKYTNTIDYLTLSQLLKIKYPLGVIIPYIISGFQYDILLNKNIESEDALTFNSYKIFNIGMSVGIGSEVKNILSQSILVEYRYERDLFHNISFLRPINYSHVILLGIAF